jgi:maleamate amidohydrolase
MSDEHHCWDAFIDEATKRTYAAYDRPRRLGPAPALVLIDMYCGLFEGGARPIAELLDNHPASCGEAAWATVAPTRRLLEACRAAGMPVLFSTGRVGRKVSATKRNRAGRTAAFYDILPELARREEDPLIVKDRASAFYGTSLVPELVMRGVRSVILGGGTTSGCLRASAVDAYSNGFSVAVVEECCFDRNTLSHVVNLFDLHMKYADVLHVDDVVEQIAG